MSVNEDFWEDLLSHIRQRVLVPVVGPDLAIVDVGNAEHKIGRASCRERVLNLV